MKILHITNGLTEGGVEMLLYDLCYETKKQGHDITILVLNKNEIKLAPLFEELGIHILTGHPHTPYDFKNIIKIKKHLLNFDLVHVHQFPSQLYTAIALLCLPKKKRPIIITTEHSTFNNRRKYKIANIVDRFFYSKYQKIICISKQTEINLIKWINNKSIQNKIITITNGINIDKFANAINICNEIIPINPQYNYIVMVGRFDSPKDQMTLIKALKYCTNNTYLIFIGTGSNMQKCMIEAKNLGLTNRIYFIGHHNNVAGILKGCKIGVLSTQWDGFGLVAVEYMASGIPAVCSNVEGLRDVVGNGSLLFNPGNVNELASLLNKLLNNTEFYNSMKSYCTNNAKKYSVKLMAQKYISLYQDLYKQKDLNQNYDSTQN